MAMALKKLLCGVLLATLAAVLYQGRERIMAILRPDRGRTGAAITVGDEREKPSAGSSHDLERLRCPKRN